MLFLRIILLPFFPVFKFGVWLRNYLFERNIFKSHKVNAKVISVGNITVGGSGKTPAVIYLTQMLKAKGLKPGVLSRGYRRKSSGYKLVSDGNKIQCSVKNCGDEIIMTALECKVPSAVCEKRVVGAERLLNDTSVNTIVLDDAFQHRWIHRDLDIVIFDQRFLLKAGGMEQNLLPVGMMRESFRSLKRADLIIINRKFSEEIPLPLQLREHFEAKKIFTAHYKTAGMFDVKDHQKYNIDEFKGQKSLVVCGIARPYSFTNVLNQNNINSENQIVFTDHKDYTHKEVELIRKKFYSTNSHSVITTEKDAIKLTEFSKELDDIDIYYLKIQLEIDDHEQFSSYIMEKLNLVSIK